jgi:predicted patatin/cPLA2 family phospholipase
MAKKRALIVEGGGIRGAHSAGVLLELSRRSPPHFDVVCGSSAGSCSLAFWVSEQPHLLKRIWGNYLHKDFFIKYRRLIMPGPIMDLDYLIKDVFVKKEPLDTEKILSSSIDFFFTATHCRTGKAHYFHNKDPINILEALQAGAAIPLVYPLPAWSQGEPFADGGISDAIPVNKALAAGCDEIWIVLTRPKGYRKKPISLLSWPRWIFRQYPALASAILERHIHYNRQLELVEELERQGKAIIIYPQPDLPVSRLTRNRQRILAAIAQGQRDAASLLAKIDFN